MTKLRSTIHDPRATTLRMAIAQMNPTVGDYKANTRKILTWIQRAEKEGADLIVFPEMALHGYPVWDLANKKRFVEEGLRCLDKITQSTRRKKIHVLLGFIEPGDCPSFRKGQSLSHNALAWIQGGQLRGVQHKTLLPTYDVFLEKIFFKPSKSQRLFTCGKLKIGPTICEDIWDDGYEVKPVRELVKQGANFIVNVSASPFYKGVSDSREALLVSQAKKIKRPILYVNQVGGQDDLVFDGRSLFVDEKANILFRAPAFEEGLFFYDWERRSGRVLNRSGTGMPVPYKVVSTGTPAEMYQALVLGVRDYCLKNRFSKVLIGLSGGIDSALVAAIAVDALGAEAVTGVTMPSGFSSVGSWSDSEALARNLRMECRKHSIKEKFDFLVGKYWQHYLQEGRAIPKQGQVTLSMENLQARIRGLELMFLSNHEGRLLLSTGNKSELAMGYCTLYGDMAGGLCVLGDVYKTDVYRLACYRNSLGMVIPEAIIAKAPSAELRPNQKDQDSLPPYESLDEVLDLYIEQNQSRDDIIHHFRAKKIRSGRGMPGFRSPGGMAPSQREIADILRKVDHNEYKRRQTPPLIRVTRKAWFGRRMPITNRFEA